MRQKIAVQIAGLDTVWEPNEYGYNVFLYSNGTEYRSDGPVDFTDYGLPSNRENVVRGYLLSARHNIIADQSWITILLNGDEVEVDLFRINRHDEIINELRRQNLELQLQIAALQADAKAMCVGARFDGKRVRFSGDNELAHKLELDLLRVARSGYFRKWFSHEFAPERTLDENLVDAVEGHFMASIGHLVLHALVGKPIIVESIAGAGLGHCAVGAGERNEIRLECRPGSRPIKAITSSGSGWFRRTGGDTIYIEY